jgi:hypothetical protein
MQMSKKVGFFGKRLRSAVSYDMMKKRKDGFYDGLSKPLRPAGCADRGCTP